MKINAISLMEAYLIETVRASGVTNEELEESVSKKTLLPGISSIPILIFKHLLIFMKKITTHFIPSFMMAIR